MKLKIINNSLTGIIALYICHTAALANDYTHEADIFLKSMPENLQRAQAEAVTSATKGDTGNLEAVRKSRNTTPSLPSGIECTDIGEKLRLFRNINSDNDTVPLLIYLHGGGWAFGSINSCSRYCGAMAEKDIAVLAVEYSLAPENPYPSGLEDCVEAVRTATDSLTTWKCGKISIGGDSSGGNLAIATAMSLPENTFASLILFYPVTKAYSDGSDDWLRYGKGYGLDSCLMDAFNSAYTDIPHNPLVSPADAPYSMLKPLPPTLIVAAERDILRAQGYEFANRLQQSGNEVEYTMFPGAVHLFITVAGQNKAFEDAVTLSSDFILKH